MDSHVHDTYFHVFKMFLQSKLFDHDNMKYLKKLLDELESVMDQVETELQRRVEETPGNRSHHCNIIANLYW